MNIDESSNCDGAVAVAKINMRMGVLSDVHIDMGPDSEKYLVRAFEYFRDNGADCVMIGGDIATSGRIAELKRTAEAWYRVFPDDRAPDGRHVEKLFIYGNHDFDAFHWRSAEEQERLRDEFIDGHPEDRPKIWEDCFHEKFVPVWMKEVNGYKVIGCHWGYRKEFQEFFAVHADELKGMKPFFYVQHDHPMDTCFGKWAWGHDDGSSTRILSQFPNCVAFSGHSHYTLTDERTVWQGAFTSINTSSMCYSSTDYSMRDNMPGNESGYKKWQLSGATPNIPTGNGKQGMLLDVYDDKIVIHRREFFWGESLGDDWTITVPCAVGGPMDYAVRAARRSAPEFAPDAVISLEPIVETEKDAESGETKETGKKGLKVMFPSALPVDNCRPNEYEVTVTLLEDDIDLVACQKRVMAADYHMPLSQFGKPCECLFTSKEIPQDAHLHVAVRPIECFGKKGKAITGEVKG